MREELRGNRCQNPKKPKTQIKMKTTKKYKVNYCMTCRTGYRSSERIWLMKAFLQSHKETRRLGIETLPVLLMNYPWSREQKWNWARGRHSVCTHFPKDPKLRYLLEDENNKGFLQKTCWYSRTQSGNFLLIF